MPYTLRLSTTRSIQSISLQLVAGPRLFCDQIPTGQVCHLRSSRVPVTIALTGSLPSGGKMMSIEAVTILVVRYR